MDRIGAGRPPGALSDWIEDIAVIRGLYRANVEDSDLTELIFYFE